MTPFEVAQLCLLVLSVGGVWIHLKTKVDDHLESSKIYREKIDRKTDDLDKACGGCRLNFTTQINGLSSKVDVSEAHHQENKAILTKLESSIEALHRRLDEVLKKGS